MKRETKQWLTKLKREKYYGSKFEQSLAADALDSDAALRAEIRRLQKAITAKDIGLRTAIAEFKRRGASPWLPMVECEAALNVALKPRKAKR